MPVMRALLVGRTVNLWRLAMDLWGGCVMELRLIKLLEAIDTLFDTQTRTAGYQWHTWIAERAEEGDPCAKAWVDVIEARDRFELPQSDGSDDPPTEQTAVSDIEQTSYVHKVVSGYIANVPIRPMMISKKPAQRSSPCNIEQAAITLHQKLEKDIPEAFIAVGIGTGPALIVHVKKDKHFPTEKIPQRWNEWTVIVIRTDNPTTIGLGKV